MLLLLAQHTAAVSNVYRKDVGKAGKVPDTACSQLAAAGSCISTVLHSLALILRALCQHDAAAFVLHVPQACAKSGSAFHLLSLLLRLLLLWACATVMMAVLLATAVSCAAGCHVSETNRL